MRHIAILQNSARSRKYLGRDVMSFYSSMKLPRILFMQPLNRELVEIISAFLIYLNIL